MITDAELLVRSRADPDAFGSLYRRHVDAVHAFLARRLGTGQAEDLLSEVFLHALEARHRVKPHDSGSALPWLYGIARNVVLQNARAKRFAVGHEAVDKFDWDQVDDSLDAAASAPGLRVALAGLGATDREVLLLVAWEQLTMSEIADVLGIKPGAARTRLHRARAHAAAALVAAQPTFQTQEIQT